MSIKKPRAVRCAVYTRKSTDENLDRDFNSLDAQRECCELYIASMRNEGWVCLPDRYDDGGFSGGNTDRPALKRLLDDIRAGRIDTVVAYKIDRLSRSLLDFARLSETFETNKVSFVSVTQQFNSSDSMGRLTLNMLMSFAQFEREVISDRTRDKIAATRRRGRWTGGRPVLGYRVDPATRGLVIEPAEAERVRAIFNIYLERKSLLATAQELARRGWVTKSSAGRAGRTWGGRPYDKTNLQKLLRCVLYTGKLPFKGNLYDGEHGRIVESEVFTAVQELLKSNGRDGGMHVRNKHGALLKGVLECSACGTAMVHTFTNKSDKAYRYYRCCNAMRRGARACPCPTLPAEQLEGLVLEQVKARLGSLASLSTMWAASRAPTRAGLSGLGAFAAFVRFGMRVRCAVASGFASASATAAFGASAAGPPAWAARCPASATGGLVGAVAGLPPRRGNGALAGFAVLAATGAGFFALLLLDMCWCSLAAGAERGVRLVPVADGTHTAMAIADVQAGAAHFPHFPPQPGVSMGRPGIAPHMDIPSSVPFPDIFADGLARVRTHGHV